MRKSNKIISLILVISLIFTMFPTQVFANDSASTMPDVVGNAETIVKPESNIIGEIVDKRDKNIKHYLKDDNTYEAVIYPTAVHYKENGKWKDVDNTLAEQTDTEEKQQVLENKNNSYKVKFAKNSNAIKLVKIKKDGYELSWGVENVSKSDVQIKPTDIEALSKLSANEQKMTLTNISSSIDYKDVFPNVDLNYDILPEQIKENIIIKSKTDNPVFRFKFNLSNLIPELLPNNTIVFYDAKDAKTKVFEIDAPYMFDAGNAESTDIKLQLEKGSDGKYIVTITPSKEWLNSEDRKYPVTVDPTVETSVNEPAKIHDAHVSENYPTTNYDQSFLLKTGKGSLSGDNKTFISFDLPQLNASDLVIKAELSMALAVTNDVAAGQVDVQKVESSWNQSTITWNNQPSINSIVEDFKMVQGVWRQRFVWDITNIAKEWYATKVNNGLALSNHYLSTGYNEYYSSNTGSTYANYRPFVKFTYVNSTGLEDYWTYETQSAGRAGTGHVNNYNGNLVFVHDDMQTTGYRLPVGISHIYNSISNFDESGKDIGYGPGWRLNLSQTIISETIGTKQYYTYTDEDGTKHYFDSSTYKDESGLNLSLTVEANSYKIEDNGGNMLIFNSDGKLSSIKDNNGNTITLEYFNGRLIKILDGATSSSITNLNYDANNRLQTIVDPNGRTTAYEYELTTNRLNKITYPDGEITTYSYDVKGNLTTVQNHDGYKIVYTYNSVAPYRVKDFSEEHTSGASGEKVSITYGNNKTVLTKLDQNGQPQKITYIFNDNGNVLSVFDNEGNEQSLGYKDPDSENSISNTVYTSTQPRKTILNYLLNHNVEATTYWTSNSSADSTGSAAFSSDYNYLGSKSLKINKTNTSGYHTFQQSVSVSKGKTYTYSGYIKTVNVSANSGKGAQLYVSYQDGTGAWKKAESKFINNTDDKWQRIEMSFTLPSDSVSNTVQPKVTLNGESGTVYFDCLQLEDGNIANGYNLLENANLTKEEVIGVPAFWTKNSFTDGNDALITDDTLETGNKVFKINGVADKQKNLSQTVNISGNAGDVLVVGGWAKGASVPLDDNNAWHFAIDIGLEKVGGGIEWHGVEFNHDSNDWQYALSEIKAKSAFTKVYYYVLYYNNANTAYFDRLELYKEGFGENYYYNTEDQLIKETDVLGRAKEYTYDKNKNVSSVKDFRGNKTSYVYDDKHNLTGTSTPEYVSTSYIYDDFGNITTTTIESGSSDYIRSSSTYTEDGKNISSITDPSGNTVNYEYYNEVGDIRNGLLKTVIDPKNQATNYDYDDESLKLKSVSKTVGNQNVTNSYTYQNDLLSTITHNGFNYNFDYDDFGKIKKVSVGMQDLVNYTYESKSKKVSKIEYGNKIGGIKQYLDYSYDSVDRVTSMKIMGEEKFKYEYDENGNVGYHEDIINNIKFRYIYDVANRLTKVNASNGDTTAFSYDNNDNVENINEKIGNNNYNTSYVYDRDNRNTNVTTTKGKNISYHFDDLGRLDNKTINTATPFVTSYAYKHGDYTSPSTATNVLETINNQGNTISYTYDANGNISTITENGNVTEYLYNELDELIRENNQTLNKTIVYAYDAGGNILTKTEYPYTTGAPSNPTKTYTYTYGDANWKDKLTNYDGKSISYDDIGNIKNYNGYTYSWERGRQLSSISKTGFNASYKYNDQGIRTEKTVNGVVTKYHLVNGNVTQESNGTDVIYYTYDADDNLVSMILNNVEYFYVKNGQGDITGLIDSNGTQVVNYVYDTWGKLISITGSLTSTVGEKNPYRYRSYRYDAETGLYYLQSRYYNPEWGRFINADYTGILQNTQGELLSANLYSYCANNPINNSDSSGLSFEKIKNGANVLLDKFAEYTDYARYSLFMAGYMTWETVNLPKYLSNDAIKFSVSNTQRLQHAYKHASDLGFGNWNKINSGMWKDFITNALKNTISTFDNVIGRDPVKGYYSVINGNDVAVYIYKEGPYKGLVATVVKLSQNQMVKFKLK